jgi:pimeloyl-ACP methyl ester carboxylesterase
MGGSNRLPEDLQALARAEQRMVIGLQYHSLVGSTKLVDADNMNEPAPEIDVEQADDLVRLLEAQGIEQVDAAGLSRGCIRLEIAMKQHPELFRDAYLLHPAGLDERTYRQSHIDAAREKIARITRRSNHNVEAISETSSTPKNRARRQNWRDQRLEQKSVARADLASTLGDLDPNIHVTVAGDKSDRAFQIDRLPTNE